MKKIIPVLVFSTIFLLINSCNFSGDGFKKTDTGLKYKFILQNKGAEKPEIGDLLEVQMIYSYNDSIIFNSTDYTASLPLQLIEPMYQADIVEGIALLGLGDSAIFIVNADSFYYKNVGLKELPDFIVPNSELYFYISLVSIKKKAVFEAEQQEFNKQRQALLQIMENEELELREKYLKSNNIKISPTASGLYFIEKKAGSGKRALPGTIVQVHYSGLLLDGSVFDSSYDRNQPITFKIGGRMVIDGFEEGIAMMREGGKAKLILPSEIAYGDNELENIPPYSTLIYEVELVKVD